MSAVPFPRLARVEATKLVDTRSGRWLVGLALLALVVALIVAVAAPRGIDQDLREYVRGAGFASSALLPLAAILLITTEWTQRTALVTFVQEPRRLHVLAAKGAACVGLALAAAVLCLVLAALALALSAGLGRDVAWSPGPPVGGLVGYLVLQTLFGFAIGVLVQHTAGAIVSFFLAPLAVAAVTSLPFLDGAGPWLDTGRFSALLDGSAGGEGGHLAVTIGLWIVAPLALGALRTVRRDVA